MISFRLCGACRARSLAACMGQYAEAVTAARSCGVVMNQSNASYQHLRAALEDVAGYPVDTQADLLFVLPDPGCFQAATAADTVRT